MVNSILAGDLPRINSFLKNSKVKDKYKNSPYLQRKISDTFKQIPAGNILICKVLIPKGKYDSKHPYFDIHKSPSEIYQENPVDSEIVDVNKFLAGFI